MSKQARWGRRAAVAVVGVAVVGGGVAWGASASAGNGHAHERAHALDGFSITPSSPQVMIGDQVSVTVSATAASDLYAYDVELSYDPTVLSYVDQSGSTDVSGSTYVTTPVDGDIKLLHTKLGTSPSAAGAVDLVTVTFTALKDADTSVSVPSLVQVDSDDTSTTLADVASADVAVVKKAAPTAETPPSIDGTAEAGYTLTATPPTWSVDGVSDSYQWLRGDVPIPGADGATYVVRRVDVGNRLRVEVSGAKDDYATGVATAATSEVAPSVTTTKATPKLVTTTSGDHATVKIVVAAHGLTPTGKVVVRNADVTKRTALAGGQATITLALRHAGKHTLLVKYLPRTGFAASHVKVVVTTR